MIFSVGTHSLAGVISGPYTASLPPLYRLALGVVAVTMALLPVCYLTMVGVVIYGVYFFVSRYFVPIWILPVRYGGVDASVELGKVMLSFVPPFLGTVVAAAMLKPLFAKQTPAPEAYRLDPGQDAKLVALVQEICRALGTPPPFRIALDCSVNASASYTDGWGGFFRRRVTLTLGLPLVAGLAQQELAGVVAHEVGHFRQRAGMGATFLIRSVNGWFERVIYGRDRFDRWLVHCTDGSGGNDPRILMFTGSARLAVSAARGVLWLLMMAGRLVSTALLRQMEYDADRCEMFFAGTDSFVAVMEKLPRLGAAWEDAHRQMRQNWNPRHRLPENLPELVEAAATQMLPGRGSQVEESKGRKTKFLDTHPSQSDRLRRARSTHVPSQPRLSGASARELFQNFIAVSRLLTLSYYEKNLRLPIQAVALVSTDEWLEEQAKAEKAAQERRVRLRRVAVPRIQ